MGPAVILMVIIAPFCYGASIQYKRSDVKPLQTNISGWFIEETNKTFQSLEGPENLHEFLEEHLEKPILECTLSPLTKPGENYRSELQALEVKFNESNHSNKVNLISKSYGLFESNYYHVFNEFTAFAGSNATISV